MKKARHTFTALSKLTISSFSKPSSVPQSLSLPDVLHTHTDVGVIPWSPTSAPSSKILSASSQSLEGQSRPCIYFCYVPPPTLCCAITAHTLCTSLLNTSYIPLHLWALVQPYCAALKHPEMLCTLCLSYPRFKAVFSFINLFLILKPCFLPCWKLIILLLWKENILYTYSRSARAHVYFPAHVYFLSIA